MNPAIPASPESRVTDLVRVIQVGSTVGGYELVAKLGRGGMASLFVARKLGAHGFERLAAVKVVHPHLTSQDPGLTLRFADEARTTARIDHPNVVHVEDFGELDGTCYLAMEYVHGCSLAQLLRALGRRGRRVVPELAVHIIGQVAAGLHGAHETKDEEGRALSIVHRDVSPQNVLLSYSGHIKLIDFGIAKARFRQVQTKSIRVRGKLAYMAPEQLLGRPLDRRADVYALAIVLWEMLTMKRYFSAPNDFVLMDRVRSPVPRPLREHADVSEEFEHLMLRALSPDMHRRPATARDLRKSLLRACPGAAALDSADVAEVLQEMMSETQSSQIALLPADVSEEISLPAPRSEGPCTFTEQSSADGSEVPHEWADRTTDTEVPSPPTESSVPPERVAPERVAPEPRSVGRSNRWLIGAGVLLSGLVLLGLLSAFPDGEPPPLPTAQGQVNPGTDSPMEAEAAAAPESAAIDVPAAVVPTVPELVTTEVDEPEPGGAPVPVRAIGAGRANAHRPTAEDSSSAADPREVELEREAVACAGRGDNACVVRVLDGEGAPTAVTLGLLIAAHRSAGRTTRAMQHMRTFVRRYPDHDSTPSYRAFLARH